MTQLHVFMQLSVVLKLLVVLLGRRPSTMDADDPPGAWIAFCPYGDRCQKGGKRLGGYGSDGEASAAVKNHLMTSTYHWLDEQDRPSSKTYQAINQISFAMYMHSSLLH